MSANSIGERFGVTAFGESHGAALGVVIDGCPAGVVWDQRLLERELERRRPGTSKIVSARKENDKPEVLSGVYAGKTLGTPIAVIVRNQDQRSADYAKLEKSVSGATVFRRGHADDLWRAKFGHSDVRGGGRASGRETVARVMAGAVAQMLLKKIEPKLRVTGFAREIGPYALTEADLKSLDAIKQKKFVSDRFAARFPSKKLSRQVEKMLVEAKASGKSFGGVAEIWVDGVPKGLGQPVFHKLKADLASALMGVGATTAFEIGDGFSAVSAEGSEFHMRKDNRRYGGIRGGISTGERLILRVGFKPTASVLEFAKQGRHDPCIVPRAIPVLEAMTWLVLADHALWHRTDRA